MPFAIASVGATPLTPDIEIPRPARWAVLAGVETAPAFDEVLAEGLVAQNRTRCVALSKLLNES